MIRNKKIKFSLLIIVIASMFNVILLWFGTINFSCGLSIIQNIVIPYFLTTYLIQEIRSLLHIGFKFAGILIGIVTGMIPATTMFIITRLNDYLEGNNKVLNTFHGQPVPNSIIFQAEIVAPLFLWTLLILISAFVGFFSSILNSNKYERMKELERTEHDS